MTDWISDAEAACATATEDLEWVDTDFYKVARTAFPRTLKALRAADSLERMCKRLIARSDDDGIWIATALGTDLDIDFKKALAAYREARK